MDDAWSTGAAVNSLLEAASMRIPSWIRWATSGDSVESRRTTPSRWVPVRVLRSKVPELGAMAWIRWSSVTPWTDTCLSSGTSGTVTASP
ncbi:MAG: hypothetical protein ACPGPE_09155, partial [Planctomycetota bacterium]